METDLSWFGSRVHFWSVPTLSAFFRSFVIEYANPIQLLLCSHTSPLLRMGRRVRKMGSSECKRDSLRGTDVLFRAQGTLAAGTISVPHRTAKSSTEFRGAIRAYELWRATWLNLQTPTTEEDDPPMSDMWRNRPCWDESRQTAVSLFGESQSVL